MDMLFFCFMFSFKKTGKKVEKKNVRGKHGGEGFCNLIQIIFVLNNVDIK